MNLMKMHLMIFSLIALLASNAVAAAWTGSTSEPENMKKIDGKPFYVITTADELAWFAAQVNGGKTTINAVLGNDIVFGKNNSAKCTVKWTPIGKDTQHQFAGILDGAGYTIYGIYVDSVSIAGIVGALESGGVVKNLRTNSGSIRGSFRAGGFVAHNEGLIQDVENNNKVEAVYKKEDSTSIYIGGIVGHNNGTITTSFNKASVKDTDTPTRLNMIQYSGGVVGYNTGLVDKSKNSGSVTLPKIYAEVHSFAGGIAASNKGIIRNCSNSGNLSSNHGFANTTSYVGGIAAYNISSINNCANTGSLSAIYNSTYSNISAYVGGIVGYNETSSAEVKNSYSLALSIGTLGTRGGVAGKNTSSAQIINSHYDSDIIAACSALGTVCSAIGSKSGTVTNVSGMTTANMQKDQFAWMLNTTNGTEENSGVWTRGTDGYPTFANEDSLPIYKVVFNDDGVTSNRYTNYKGLATFPDNPEPAENFIFKGWYNSEDVKVKPSTIFTADQTVNAVYVEASDVYWTINFFNTDSKTTLLQTKQYQHGSIVSYEGDVPTKETTAQYTYTFKGWNAEPSNAVEDFDYYAVYDSTLRSYSISFKDFDGTLIESASFDYGVIPSCSKVPSRIATAEWMYTHKGWKPALDYVTEATAYTASYDSTKMEYKVTFMNGIDIVDEQMVPYGGAAVAPTNVAREGYKFVGWNATFANVTENLTVKALFEELITYIVKVIGPNDEKIDSVKVEENETYVLPTAPKKDGYTFDAYYNGDNKIGTAGTEISVVSDITITAKYSKNPESSSSSIAKSSSSSAPKSSSSVKSSSSIALSSSSSKTTSSSSNKIVIYGNLEQTLGINDWMETIIFRDVQSYVRESYDIPFLKVEKSGIDLSIYGTVPETYRDLVCNGTVETDSLTVNGNVYKIKLTIRNPNKPCNSSSMPISISVNAPFTVKTLNRGVQIAGAKVGSAYAIFDMQGKVLKMGLVELANFNIVIPRAGNYLIRIENYTQKFSIK